MPAAAHPRRRDFYVYALTAGGVVFYVGIGHSTRVTDRARWVKSQAKRKARGMTSKWVRHTRVAEKCLRGGIDISYHYLKPGMTRAHALEHEQRSIAWYLSRGYMLANHHYNSGYSGTAAEVVQHIRLRMARRSRRAL